MNIIKNAGTISGLFLECLLIRVVEKNAPWDEHPHILLGLAITANTARNAGLSTIERLYESKDLSKTEILQLIYSEVIAQSIIDNVIFLGINYVLGKCEDSSPSDQPTLELQNTEENNLSNEPALTHKDGEEAYMQIREIPPQGHTETNQTRIKTNILVEPPTFRPYRY